MKGNEMKEKEYEIYENEVEKKELILSHLAFVIWEAYLYSYL